MYLLSIKVETYAHLVPVAYKLVISYFIGLFNILYAIVRAERLKLIKPQPLYNICNCIELTLLNPSNVSLH